MKDYIEYMDKISVEAALHEKILQKMTRKTLPIKRSRTLFRYTAMAACAIILMFCVWTIPDLINNPNDRQDFEPLFIGLPVDNFSLGDIESESGIMAYRMAYFNLSSFFTFRAPDMFAFVRVLDTEQTEDKQRSYRSLRQDSTLQILSAVWSSEIETPEIITLEQYLYGGCLGDEKTNLLRMGGVYLLPLKYYQQTDMWYIMGDLDVLFEVDDKGQIWTHSPFEDFKRFDGKDASFVTEAIINLTSDENFPAAITQFGQYSREWGILAESTVLSVTLAQTKWGDDCYRYVFEKNNILSKAKLYESWQLDGDETVGICYETQIVLEQGARYLMILDIYEDEVHIHPGRTAKINNDGTITAVSSGSENIFWQFNGYTVEQMKEEAERAKVWHEAHVK